MASFVIASSYKHTPFPQFLDFLLVQQMDLEHLLTVLPSDDLSWPMPGVKDLILYSLLILFTCAL